MERCMGFVGTVEVTTIKGYSGYVRIWIGRHPELTNLARKKVVVIICPLKEEK